jgi:predicted RNA polymerase sigma factor
MTTFGSALQDTTPAPAHEWQPLQRASDGWYTPSTRHVQALPRASDSGVDAFARLQRDLTRDEDEAAQEIVRTLERWNQSGDFTQMDAFLAQVTRGAGMPAHILLNVLALTRFAREELPSRPAFVESAEKALRAEVGEEQATRWLSTRR